MRKNTARHWLHATLDLLPVLLIPVFMIYSHRHTIDSGSIEVPQSQVVDFNQVLNNDNARYTDLINYTFDNNVYTYTPNSYYNLLYFLDVYNVGDIYITKINVIDGANAQYQFYDGVNLFSLDSNSLISYRFSAGGTNLYIRDFSESNWTTKTISNIQVFNLTQMFGSGNEPTLNQFNQWYTDDYYSYTLSHKELLKNYTTITYDDTDIMSQVVYQLYNSVDKYFNMGNVFGMSGLYDWFNMNIFNGTAPISIYIVWNIVLYEFVMDLLFLLYALFMWFIDMCKRLMEKPLDSIK